MTLVIIHLLYEAAKEAYVDNRLEFLVARDGMVALQRAWMEITGSPR